MHIKTIVLDNFKSFGRKTRIPLYEDFTTISGPNGSGKSNIIDAVLFALGLARTRGIRAHKLTDLIYNPGHEDDRTTEGPREASVEVVLDNTDETLTRSQVVSAAGSERVGDTDELTVRRRIKQTEDNYYSYYYLNDRSVNLSDIRELLAAAGVTPEGYNVVMQGDVTEIINMTPVERREIIDEIAGVAEFDAKKADAREELETVEERIGEADTRIEEKQTRLDQLADERDAALEYQELREEKSHYEGYLKAAELEDKRERRADLTAEIEELEAELETRQRTLDERRGKVTRLEEDLEDLNAEIERKGEDEQLELREDIERLKGEIERFNDRIEEANERIESAQADRREAFVEHDRKEEELESIEADIRETKLEQSSIKAEIKDRKADLADVKAEIEAVDTEYDELKERLQDLKTKREARKEEKHERQREQDRLLDEARRRSNEIEDAKETLTELESELEELATTERDLEAELEKAEANYENIDEVVNNLTAEKRSLNERLEELADTLQAKQQEYAELEARAERDGEHSYGRAVTTIIEANLDGVHGTVGQLGAVEDRYATACETAGGGRLANVVVDDDTVGQRCIEHLKQRNAGRATFLPLTEMDDRGVPGPPAGEGVIDFAYNLVDFDEQYAGVFSYVLGDTLVVEDIETAREYMGRYRLVTLEGELVEKSGAMTGGSTSGSRYSFSKTGGGKLQRLASEISDLQEEQTAVKSELRDVEDRLESARERRADAKETRRSIESELEDVAEQRNELQAEIETTDAKIEELQSEREAVDAEMNDLAEEIDALEETIAELDEEITEVETELEDSKIPTLTAQAEEIEADIDGLQSRLDDLDAQLNQQELQKQYIEETIEGLDDEIETAQNEIADQRERIETYETEIEERETALEEKREAIADLEEELADLKEERERLNDRLREATRERDEARDAVADVEAELDDRREARQRIDWEIDQLEDEVGTYDPEEIPAHEEVTDRIETLEAEMETLEPVNMLAIDEYDAVQEDLDALKDRRSELDDERAAIEDQITAYEDQKRETFLEAYHAIDDQFQRIFSRLSDGTGELVLADESAPFEGGLTMRAEPADKPIQRLEAMSGGEKSLTALSFIFAIQRYEPAPFYALDEIDAFLDAANAERVGELVDELAGDAQFIVVSHRSAMLDRSERAIGVTMQGDNISTVTGIDLAEGVS